MQLRIHAPGGRRESMADNLTERLFRKALRAARIKRVTALGYEPDESAPQAGFWDKSSGLPIWKQQHSRLVQDAINSIKGAYSDMQIAVEDELRNEPAAPSGSGKIMRQRGAALLWELLNNGRKTPKLYRGSHVKPSGLTAWTEDFRIASEWAKRNGGIVWEKESGGTGLRAADYILHDVEKEWILIA